MARRAGSTFNEKDLTKGEVRKLTALRRSIGDDLGTKAFAEWLKTRSTGSDGPVDKNKAAIILALEPLIKANKFKIPRGGYILRRGRRRVILDRP